MLLWKDYGWILIEFSTFDFRQISQVRTCNYFQFLNSHKTCYLCIKKSPNQAKELINMVCFTLEGLWMVSYRIVDCRFFVKFHRSGPAIIFQFLNSHKTCYSCIKKAPNQGKDFINMVCVTLEGLWMVCDRIVDCRFFVPDLQ